MTPPVLLCLLIGAAAALDDSRIVLMLLHDHPTTGPAACCRVLAPGRPRRSPATSATAAPRRSAVLLLNVTGSGGSGGEAPLWVSCSPGLNLTLLLASPPGLRWVPSIRGCHRSDLVPLHSPWTVPGLPVDAEVHLALQAGTGLMLEARGERPLTSSARRTAAGCDRSASRVLVQKVVRVGSDTSGAGNGDALWVHVASLERRVSTVVRVEVLTPRTAPDDAARRRTSPTLLVLTADPMLSFSVAVGGPGSSQLLLVLLSDRSLNVSARPGVVMKVRGSLSLTNLVTHLQSEPRPLARRRFLIGSVANDRRLLLRVRLGGRPTGGVSPIKRFFDDNPLSGFFPNSACCGAPYERKSNASSEKRNLLFTPVPGQPLVVPFVFGKYLSFRVVACGVEGGRFPIYTAFFENRSVNNQLLHLQLLPEKDPKLRRFVILIKSDYPYKTTEPFQVHCLIEGCQKSFVAKLLSDGTVSCSEGEVAQRSRVLLARLSVRWSAMKGSQGAMGADAVRLQDGACVWAAAFGLGVVMVVAILCIRQRSDRRTAADSSSTSEGIEFRLIPAPYSTPAMNCEAL